MKPSLHALSLPLFPLLLLLLAGSCCVRPLYAAAARQAAAHPNPATASAAELAHRVDDHYNHLRTMRASFSEQYTGMGMERDDSGTLLLARPGQMKWVYTQPRGKYFLLNGRYAYFYATGNEQVQRMKASQLDDLRSPLRFLLGHTKIAAELTNLHLSNSGAEFTLVGVPRGAAKRIVSVALTVTAAGEITAIVIREQDGSTTRFTLTGEEDNPALAPETFRFTPPPGVPVSDALPPA